MTNQQLSSMCLTRTLDFVHQMIASRLHENAVVVDATVGNGHDTLFLATHAQKVYGFDIQLTAIEATKQCLSPEVFKRVVLILDTHENMQRYIKEPIDVVVFNLGYLPGGDKTLTTKTQTTIKAIEAALSILKPDGLLVVTVYPGHEEGQKEAVAVENLAKSLHHQNCSVLKYQFLNHQYAPYSLFIEKHA